MFTDTSKDDFNYIAQAKSSKSKGDETQTKKQNAEQCHATRFSEWLIKHSNHQSIILGEDDDKAASKTECKYCKYSAKKRLIHPCSRIRDVYSSSQIKISVNEDEVNHNDFSDVFAFNHQHSNMFDYDFRFKISKGFPKSCNIIGLITSRNQEKLK